MTFKRSKNQLEKKSFKSHEISTYIRNKYTYDKFSILSKKDMWKYFFRFFECKNSHLEWSKKLFVFTDNLDESFDLTNI